LESKTSLALPFVRRLKRRLKVVQHESPKVRENVKISYHVRSCWLLA